MTLKKELEAQLLSLSPEEKAKAIQILAHSLNVWHGIEKTPGVMGGDACIVRTRIPIWLLVSYRRLGTSDAELLDNYPTLSATDLANAWAYAEANADEIETAIREQQEA